MAYLTIGFLVELLEDQHRHIQVLGQLRPEVFLTRHREKGKFSSSTNPQHPFRTEIVGMITRGRSSVKGSQGVMASAEPTYPNQLPQPVKDVHHVLLGVHLLLQAAIGDWSTTRRGVRGAGV